MPYKQLCEELKLEYKTNKARELQIEKLKEQYDIEKLSDQRNRYIVRRELTEEEKQYIQDSKNYSIYITNLLLDIFSQSTSATCTFTIRELRELTGMVNNKYFPVKYHKEEVDIRPPMEYHGNLYQTKQEWLGISDKMDEAILTYALGKLKKKGIIEYYNTYKLFKIVAQDENNKVFFPPHILTEEELSEFLQKQAEALQTIGLDSKQQLFYCSEGQRAEYYRIMNKYVLDLGYTNYARAITVIKPKELYKFANYFRENFNKLQVQKYLKSKRFKTIPPFLHQAMTDNLIKIKD